MVSTESGYLVINVDGVEYTVSGAEKELIWDDNGYLIEIRVSGKCQDGVRRTFRRRMEWENGMLVRISKWEVVK